MGRGHVHNFSKWQGGKYEGKPAKGSCCLCGDAQIQQGGRQFKGQTGRFFPDGGTLIW